MFLCFLSILKVNLRRKLVGTTDIYRISSRLSEEIYFKKYTDNGKLIKLNEEHLSKVKTPCFFS